MKAYLLSVDEPPRAKTLRGRWRRFVERWLPTIVIFLMVAALVIVVLFPRIVVTVPSGEVGVLWKRLEGGTILDPRELRDEGLHLIMPWDTLFIYNLRVQSLTETYNAISSDGVNMNVTINTRFRLQRDSVPALHQVVGPDYAKILGPQIASEMREVISHYTAEQVYSSARQEIQDKIRARALDKLGHKMFEREGDERWYSVALRDTVVLYDTLLYGIELPESVIAAINRKAEQYYYTSRKSTDSASSARKRNRSASVSRLRASANFSRSSVREFRTHICAGAGSKPHYNWRSLIIRRS
jgi:regulator of protease activity HflC (stomatin/prohibitin superfamily)